MSLKVQSPMCATLQDFPALLDLLDSVFSGGRRGEIGRRFAHILKEENLQNLCIIKQKGRVVSHIGLLYRRMRLGREEMPLAIISLMATHPDFRRQRFATSLLKFAIEKMQRDGIILSVVWAGIPDFYTRFGWETAGIISRVSLYDSRGLECKHTVRPYEGEIREIISLKSPEINEIIRSEAETAELLKMNEARVLLAREGEKPIAYLVYDIARTEDGLVVEVKESDGHLRGIESMVTHLFAEHNPERMDFFLPQSQVLSRYFLQKGTKLERMSTDLGLWRLIDKDSFVNKVKEATPISELDVDLERLDLEEGNLVKYLLGSRTPLSGPVPKSEIFPIRLYISRLDHA